MKTRAAILIAIAIITIQSAMAEEPTKKFPTEEKKITYAIKNLHSGLHTNNPGVIESAMRVTAQIKMRFPAVEVSELVDAINDVWLKNPSGSTRYKAYIALSVIKNPEWYVNEFEITTATDETFFKAASVRMQEELLTTNTQ